MSSFQHFGFLSRFILTTSTKNRTIHLKNSAEIAIDDRTFHDLGKMLNQMQYNFGDDDAQYNRMDNLDLALWASVDLMQQMLLEFVIEPMVPYRKIHWPKIHSRLMESLNVGHTMKNQRRPRQPHASDKTIENVDQHLLMVVVLSFGKNLTEWADVFYRKNHECKVVAAWRPP